MEKQYSVQFFTNFVDNIQSLCHTYLDFNQCVEVSGYVCVEIDNVKKERYVLSEMIQSNGRSISESYCTKVFKSAPSGIVQRSSLSNITNRASPTFDLDQREISMSQRNYTPRGQRTHIPSRTNLLETASPSRIRVDQSSVPSCRSSTTLSQTKTTFDQSSSMQSFFPESKYFPSTGGINESERRTSSFEDMTTNGETVPKAQASGYSSSPGESSLLKRRFSDTAVFESESADDDGDIVIIKEEPGGFEEEEQEEDSGEPPPIKRREESFRLPDSITAAPSQDPSSEDDFQESLSIFTFEPHGEFQAAEPDLDFFLDKVSGPPSLGQQTSGRRSEPNLNAEAIIQKIRPCPVKVNTPDGLRYTCQLCRNSTPTDMSFVMHMNAHPSCKLCGLFVGTHTDLRCHIQHEHGKTRMHKCNFCEKVFLTKGGMVEHQRLKHENTAPRFVCVMCGLVCVRKRHLDDHVENVHNKRNKGPS